MIRRIFQEEEVFNLELKAHGAGSELGRSAERERILGILKNRIVDLESCQKMDNCQNLADGIKLALSDIEWQEERSKGWSEEVAEMKQEWDE